MNEQVQTVDENEIVQRALTDFRFFVETFISIKDKDRFIVPFVFNPIQDIFYKKYVELNKQGIRKHIILKPRQLGFTTLICALFLAECILVPNTTAVIIAHDAESTARIFEITKLMYEKLPDEIRPKKRFSSKRELVFEHLNSKIFIGTAGSEKFGRGTTINLLHCSEYAFWDNPKDVLTALLEAVPKDGIIIYETTANGYNHFYDEYNEAVNTTEINRKLNQIPFPHFFRWFDHPEYQHELEPAVIDYMNATLTDEEKNLMRVHGLTLQRIAWRRAKQQSQKAKFLQEYPEDDATCFVASGKPFFDQKILKSVLLWNEENKTWDKYDEQNEIVVERGWVRKEMEGLISIYKQPKKGEQYIVCVDPAEGNPTSDQSSAFVLRLNKSPIFIEQCAEICDKIPMPKFYRLIYHLGALYGFPRMVIERNNHGHLLNYWAVNGYMQDQIKILDKYPLVYIAKDNKAGFVTSSSSRPLILDNMAELIRNNMLVIYSQKFIKQALTFVYSESGRPEADRGKFDDAIIAVSVGSFVLIHESMSSGFRFVNKEAFGVTAMENPPQTSVYDRKKLIYENKHPMDHNVFVGDPQEIDWKKFVT